jgi:diaminopimelate decarboxylase
MFSVNDISEFSGRATPFYYYDTGLLRRTLKAASEAAGEYHVHYALKANSRPELLKLISGAGFGADCVSGNEVKRAIECGFDADKIAFAGVGKTDREITEALDAGIFSFNVESLQELEVLNALASERATVAPVALRVNPNVDAFTHRYITTGLEENKFGINPYEFNLVISRLRESPHVALNGLHFHIGSQIQDLAVFRNLCLRVNEIAQWFIRQGFSIDHLNMGGGLGVDYTRPDESAIPDFAGYFGVFREFLSPPDGAAIHFELGRSLVAQCGSLISRVLFVKEGVNTNFAILDAGMTELLRPALYQAYHKIENISRPGREPDKRYDVVGPVCESSDCFGKAMPLPETRRGDLIAIRSAGAYGESMSNHYNLRSAEDAFLK